MLLLLCLSAGRGLAQPQGATTDDLSLHRDTLDVFAAQPFVLRPFVQPGSESVKYDGEVLDTTAYRLDYRHGRLWVDADRPSSRAQLVVRYRTFPFEFEDVYRRRTVVEADTSGAAQIVDASPDTTRSFDPFEGVTLQHSGSVSRGVRTGSHRDVLVTSGLRMQLSGDITDDVHVRAVLTDENAPLQPDGTTQRINDFDRVFMEVQSPYGIAQLGDVELDLEDNTFARLSRRLQGVVLSSERDLLETSGGNGQAQFTVAGAAARGTFRSQQIEVIDGVQGPYPLEGQDGERFIVVIAGSERVYMDGERLTRGERNDYVIDYETGDLTFTSQRLITEDRRVTVEFEYATHDYLRTMLATQGKAQLWQRSDGSPRLEIGSSFIREADTRPLGEGSFQSDDTPAYRLDDNGQIVRSGAVAVPFDAQAPYVQYRREIRSGEGNEADTIYVALDEAPEPGMSVYRVRFSRVGEGEGSYVRGSRSLNGLAYEYRGPGSGAYEPILRVAQPRSQHLLDVDALVEPIDGLSLYGAWATSGLDLNRLSAEAPGQAGQAYVARLEVEPQSLMFQAQPLGRLSGSYRRRYRENHFETFARIREVEFSRKWNLTHAEVSPTGGMAGVPHEVQDEVALHHEMTDRSNIGIEGGRLSMGSVYSGRRGELRLQLQERFLPESRYRLEYITNTSERAGFEGRWLRQQGRVAQPLLGGKLTPALAFEQERRVNQRVDEDSLARPSRAFTEWRPMLTYEGKGWSVGAEVARREEERPVQGEMRAALAAWTLQTHFTYDALRNLDTEARVGFRRRTFADHFRIHEREQNTRSALIHTRTRFRPFRQAVDLTAFYEARTERTPVMQELYIRTGPELGQYVWEDENEDGIVQIDELLPERTPGEGDYAKRLVPSDSLVPVVGIDSRFRLRLDPGRIWSTGSSGWKQLLAQLRWQSLLEVSEKSRSPRLSRLYLLDLSHFQVPALTQRGRIRFDHELSLFPRQPQGGVDLRYNSMRRLDELAAGAERRFNQSWEGEGRYQLANGLALQLTASRSQESLHSESFASRQYDLRGVAFRPEVSVHVSEALRLAGGVAYQRKTDQVEDRAARLVRIPVELQYAQARRFQVTAEADVAGVALSGEAGGLARFELTSGRGPGTSYRWSLNGQYTLTDYLRASLSYHGMALENSPTRNTMQLELTATF